MPVLDRKPFGKDYDDEHHSRLVDRQHRNNNDASPIFASFPIGSAVAVQQEDSRPWTHGTVVGTGDHKNHNQAYIILLTTNGRRITCNRQHTKPTSIKVDAYLQYHTTKNKDKQTDPLEDILNYNGNNPMVYASRHTHNSTNNLPKTENEDQTKDIQQGGGQDHSKKQQIHQRTLTQYNKAVKL